MPLEAATYISDFVLTNPDGSVDSVSSLDDQDKLIKTVLQNTFPNIDGAVTATPAEVNVLDGFTGSTADLNQLSGITGAVFDATTRMLFQQATAPTGWTKDTTAALDDHALRIVTTTSFTAGSLGTSAFSTVFAKTATDSHSLVIAEMPVHDHVITLTANNSSGGTAGFWGGNGTGSASPATQTEGSGGGHAHNMDIRVKYLDNIIATKD